MDVGDVEDVKDVGDVGDVGDAGDVGEVQGTYRGRIGDGDVGVLGGSGAVTSA